MNTYKDMLPDLVDGINTIIYNMEAICVKEQL